MKRVVIEPRPDWQHRVEELGFLWHTAAGEPYWNEAAYYQFTAREIDELEQATAELQRLCLEAGQAIIDRNLFSRFGIPDYVVPLIRQAWEAEPPALFHGRFDLGYDGKNPPKLFEYNADTPTSLFEAAVVQWAWKEEVLPASDQFNSLHERLIAKWTDIKPYLKASPEIKPASPYLHFAHVDDDSGEDTLTVTYLRDTALQAGIASQPILMRDIGWDADARRFVDLDNRTIDTLFHLYPWEWLVNEEFGRHIMECGDQIFWIEPIWKMLWSNKALLAVLWELFPYHPNLLPAYFEPHGSSYVKKPLLAREGANIDVVRYGSTIAQAGGDYGQEGYVYQELYDLPQWDGLRPVIGSWIVGGEPAGMGIREGGLITGNKSRFVPHVF